MILGIGDFVGEQVRRLEEVINNPNNSPKLTFYSGHDTTLWTLAFAYGFGSLSYWPPYASHMEIEVWQDQSGRANLRFFYNGRQVPVPGCTGLAPCPWGQFKSAITSIIPISYPHLCQIQPLLAPRAAAAAPEAAIDMDQFFRLM